MVPLQWAKYTWRTNETMKTLAQKLLSLLNMGDCKFNNNSTRFEHGLLLNESNEELVA